MKHIFCGEPGETMFTTSDIGWVVGHSYIIYGPLIAGMTTIMYEGVPIRPDAGVWWKIVQDYKVAVMFSAPTAIRVLKKQDAGVSARSTTCRRCKHLFLAGEPLDEPTHRWISEALGRPVIDHYWQTETGWPLLSAIPGVEKTPLKMGSPSFPVYGYDVQLLHEQTGQPVPDGEKGVVAIVPPLPPGCMTTMWGDDERFVETYFKDFKNQLVYSTFDWGIRDKDGYYFILGRTDDVINVAGHRLGTREIEEAVSMHPNVAECAVVGVADPLKGQMPLAFAVLKDPGEEDHRRGGDANGRQAARRHRAAEGGALRDAAAEDALGQDAAPLDPGARRGPRPGRSHHHRGSRRPSSRSGRRSPDQIASSGMPLREAARS